MNENISSEGFETSPATTPYAPTEPQAQVAQGPVHAPKSGVTISHRALWVGGGILLVVTLLAVTFGFGFAVGRHTSDVVCRGAGGMTWKAPNGLPDPGGDAGRRRMPPGFGYDHREFGNQEGPGGWGGRGFWGLPHSESPTGTSSP